MNKKDIIIIIVRAAGYSGATWFNIVMGCHPDAFAMGPPSRILDLDPAEAAQACFVHRDNCNLWPAFLQEKPHQGQFFSDLSEFTGKRVFILNYPPKEQLRREVFNQGFRVRHIKLVRDGRASLYSYLRHNGGREPITGFQGIVGWQIPKWDQVDRKIPDDADRTMLVRYEDMVADTTGTMQGIGDFIGIQYAEDVAQFWKYEHHLTAGNIGAIDLLCRMQGLPGYTHKRSAKYQALAEKLRKDAHHKFDDRSWEAGLSTEDLLAFDCLLGERNATHGYERDRFAPDKISDFWADFNVRKAAAENQLARALKKNQSPPGVAAKMKSLVKRLWKN